MTDGRRFWIYWTGLLFALVLLVVVLLAGGCRFEPDGLYLPPVPDAGAPPADDPCGGPCPAGGLCVIVLGNPGCYKVCEAPTDCNQRCCHPVTGAPVSVCVPADPYCPAPADGGAR